MSTVFTKIINREIPGRFVHEDEKCVAFLDITPQTEGHVLVVPREEIDQWTDLPEELASHLMVVAQRIAKAQKQAFGSASVGLEIVGFEVPHTHIHVFPTNEIADHELGRAKPASDEALDAAHAKLLAAL
ncbi:HIT family protein [Falsarthrobacter nasiphocae]|uniref:Histidine triad (HIT) family protein n=1 Tax=Falsarthrobacter nasiphocae TaxID=189863 RepID=A0AAE3YIP9_9MICC|nr:HIT family protein [Falsarthrobacter nasiphocae]MDR6892751.1 histidine triad (HIT) family protein [Falsarthrobacter nasiphocae]